MNARSQNCLKRMLGRGFIAALAVWAAHGQTLVNLGTQGRNVDFSNASATRPVKTGATMPATCAIGDLFFQTSAPDGQNLYGCTAVNSWVLLGPPAPLFFYQTVEGDGTGLPQQATLNFSSAFSVVNDPTLLSTDVDLAAVNSSPGTFGSSTEVPVITVNTLGLITGVSTASITGGGGGAVWGSITGTLSNQTDLQSALNGLQATGNYLTAVTGDVTASGPGSAVATLATVNSGPGKCGDATHVCQVTTDGKGRVTAQAPVAISAGGTGTVTHTEGTLTAGQLITGNGSGDIATGDLTGDVTTSGTTATVLATVNSTPGQCGDATHVCQVTTDAKGRVTGQALISLPTGSNTQTVETGNRVFGTVYQNTTGSTLYVLADVDNAATGNVSAFVDSVNPPLVEVSNQSSVYPGFTLTVPCFFLVPPNYYYEVTGAAGWTISEWTEWTAAGGVSGAGNGNATSIQGTPVSSAGPTDLQVLQYQASSSSYVPATISGGGNGNATSIQGTPVSSAGPTNLQVLQYQASSSSYVPTTISGSGGTDNWSSGALASIPAACTPGSGVYLYFATDQPAAQQMYTCSAANVWTQFIGLGGSGALQIVAGSLDINTAVVSQQAASETLGFKTFVQGLSLLTANTQPDCTPANRGTFWYLNNGTSKDNVQVCVWNGSAFAWVSLY